MGGGSVKRVVALGLVVAACAALPADAWGLWSRARIMSATPVELALSPDGTSGQAMGAPVLSADGRYVAFQTRVRNLFTGDDAPLRETANGGVLRRSVDGTDVDVVAPGPSTSTPQPLGLDIAISGDGRYVAFSTAVPLVAADADSARDVYVRDMAVPRTSPGAFEIVSPAENDGRDYILPAGGGAMSTDGQRLLFADLASAGSPGTLWLRLRGPSRTLVISDTTAPQGQDFGSAALSADGSTVAWVDADPRRHVAAGSFLAGESPLGGLISTFSPRVSNADLLWRRVDGGQARRVATSGDSEDPACPPGSALAPQDVGLSAEPPRGPCDGPFSQAGIRDGIDTSGFRGVTLSGSGDRVAWISPREFRGGPAGYDGAPDLFVRDMAAPGGAKATTRELTRFSPPPVVSGTPLPGVASATLDESGTQVAFTTSQRTFSLPVPSLISPSLPPTQRSVEDVYSVDLSTNLMERVTAAYDGTPIARDTETAVSSRVGSLGFGGRRIAFRSDATNLLFGDSNGIDDVFVADRFRESSGSLPQEPYTGASGGIAARLFPVWRLSVTVSRGGRVLYVDARVPGAGTLRATARTRAKKRGRSVPPVLAKASARLRAPGEKRLRLRLRSKYVSSARRSRGLQTRITVTFVPTRPAGGPAVTPLERVRDSTFRIKKSTKTKRKRTGRR